MFVAGGAAAALMAKFASINVIAAPTKELVVGLNVPLTGPYSDQGQDQLRAYRLAIEELNGDGGVMGMKIKESVGDDEANPPTAVANADRMIDRDHAVMITGGSSSATAVAVSARCEEKKTIFMAALTNADETTGSGCHRVTFRRYNNAYMSARALANTLLTKYGTGTWFHIAANYTWGWSVRDNIREVVEPRGARTIGVVLVPLGTIDFSAALSQAAAAKPDVLVITEFGKDMINCLNQAARFGLTRSSKILVPLADEYMARGAGENFDNVVTTAPYYYKYYYDQNPMSKRFIDAFRARYNVPPSNGAECAYVDMHLWRDAVERAGSPSAEAIVERLQNHKFTYTKEPNEYLRAFDHQGVNSCLVLEGVPMAQRGRDSFAYAVVLEVHPGEQIINPEDKSACKIDAAV